MAEARRHVLLVLLRGRSNQHFLQKSLLTGRALGRACRRRDRRGHAVSIDHPSIAMFVCLPAVAVWALKARRTSWLFYLATIDAVRMGRLKIGTPRYHVASIGCMV